MTGSARVIDMAERHGGVLAWATAAGINALMAVLLLHFLDVETHPDYYHRIAQNLVDGLGYTITPGGEPIVWRPPLYPLFLALFYFIFGASYYLPVVAAQVIINAAGSWVLYHFARKYFSHAVALTAAIFHALYPFTGYYLVRILPLTCFNFLFIVFVVHLHDLFQNPSLLKAFFSGILQGLLTLFKLFFQAFPFFVILCVFSAVVFRMVFGKKHYGRERIFWLTKLGMIMLAGFFMVMLPWLARNHTVTGRFPVIGAGGGFTFWLGNNIELDGLDYDQLSLSQRKKYNRLKDEILGTDAGAGSEVDLKNESKMYRAGLENIMEHPKDSALLLLKKMYRLWFSVYSTRMQRFQPFVTAFQAIVLSFSLAGLILATRKKFPLAPFLLVIIYFQVIYTMFLATLRYIVPVMPFMLLFAAYAAIELFRAVRSLRGMT